MKNKVNKKQVSASGEPNDPSAATSRKNLAPAPHKEPASGELAAALCSGLGDALSSLHRLWLNWDDVSAINGVNTYGTDEKECEIEVVFKSGKSVKAKLGEMIGIKTLSECPLAKQKPSDN